MRRVLRAIGRLLKTAAIVLGLLAVSGLVLYSFGVRIVLDGGGKPYFAFVRSERARIKDLTEHRQAQRSSAPAVQPATQPPLATPGATPALAADPVRSSPPPAAPAILWTDFRGPHRDGHYRETPIQIAWPSRGLTPMWKQPVGGGYASFVVADGRAFTIEQRGADEMVAAYDVMTGRELWTHGWTAAFREVMGGDGPRATPTWSGGRVFALGANGEFRALDDVTGRQIWRTNILQDAAAANLPWGMSASPLVVGDTVVVLPGGRNGHSVVAYDVKTGRRVWSALDDQQAYSSPELVTVGGTEQILVFSASRLMGITTDGAKVLWEHPWKTQFDVNASQPLVVGDNRVFLSSGYGTGAAVIELSREGDKLNVREVWRNIRMKNQFTSSVLYEGFIYGLDEAILACIDAATGELKWKGGRYGYGQVLLASGHLIVLTEQGDLVLVRATPERHDELARFSALEGKTWNHPAMAGGVLLVRNGTEMAAFDLRPEPR